MRSIGFKRRGLANSHAHRRGVINVFPLPSASLLANGRWTQRSPALPVGYTYRARFV
jgi:hypothetical protein